MRERGLDERALVTVESRQFDFVPRAAEFEANACE